MNQLLERKRLHTIDAAGDSMEPELALSGLADDASAMFGYHELSRRVMEAKVKINATPLQKVLRSLNIEPFSKESVEKYKKAKLQQVLESSSPVYYKHPRLYSFLELVLRVCMAFAGFCILFSLITILADNTAQPEFKTTTKIIFFTSSLGSLLLFAIIYLVVPKRPELVWNLTSIGGGGWGQEYKKEIPTFALMQMVAVKKRLPSALFFIDEIVDPQSIRKTDPFLVVSDKDRTETFYIEVWLGPGFTVGKSA